MMSRPRVSYILLAVAVLLGSPRSPWATPIAPDDGSLDRRAPARPDAARHALLRQLYARTVLSSGVGAAPNVANQDVVDVLEQRAREQPLGAPHASVGLSDPRYFGLVPRAGDDANQGATPASAPTERLRSRVRRLVTSQVATQITSGGNARTDPRLAPGGAAENTGQAANAAERPSLASAPGEEPNPPRTAYASDPLAMSIAPSVRINPRELAAASAPDGTPQHARATMAGLEDPQGHRFATRGGHPNRPGAGLRQAVSHDLASLIPTSPGSTAPGEDGQGAYAEGRKVTSSEFVWTVLGAVLTSPWTYAIIFLGFALNLAAGAYRGRV